MLCPISLSTSLSLYTLNVFFPKTQKGQNLQTEAQSLPSTNHSHTQKTHGLTQEGNSEVFVLQQCLPFAHKLLRQKLSISLNTGTSKDTACYYLDVSNECPCGIHSCKSLGGARCPHLGNITTQHLTRLDCHNRDY